MSEILTEAETQKNNLISNMTTIIKTIITRNQIQQLVHISHDYALAP